MDSTVDSTGTRMGLDWDSTVSRCAVAPWMIVHLQCGSSLPAFQVQFVACAVSCRILGPHVLASQEPPAHREASSASASTPRGPLRQRGSGSRQRLEVRRFQCRSHGQCTLKTAALGRWSCASTYSGFDLAPHVARPKLMSLTYKKS